MTSAMARPGPASSSSGPPILSFHFFSFFLCSAIHQHLIKRTLFSHGIIRQLPVAHCQPYTAGITDIMDKRQDNYEPGDANGKAQDQTDHGRPLLDGLASEDIMMMMMMIMVMTIMMMTIMILTTQIRDRRIHKAQ